MDTTRRQLLAAIPAVGIAATMGQGQDVLAPGTTWEYAKDTYPAYRFEYGEFPVLVRPRLKEGWIISTMQYIPGSLQPESDPYYSVYYRRPVDPALRRRWDQDLMASTYVTDEQGQARALNNYGKKGYILIAMIPVKKGYGVYFMR